MEILNSSQSPEKHRKLKGLSELLRNQVDRFVTDNPDFFDTKKDRISVEGYKELVLLFDTFANQFLSLYPDPQNQKKINELQLMIALGKKKKNNHSNAEEFKTLLIHITSQIKETKDTKTIDVKELDESEAMNEIQSLAVGSTLQERQQLARQNIDTIQESERRSYIENIRMHPFWGRVSNIPFVGNMVFIPDSLRRSFRHNFDRVRLNTHFSQQSMRELLVEDQNSYNTIGTGRAREYELLDSSFFETLNANENLEAYKKGKKELDEAVEKWITNKDLSEREFHSAKNKIIADMVVGQTDEIVAAVKDQADTLWIRVLERRKFLQKKSEDRASEVSKIGKEVTETDISTDLDGIDYDQNADKNAIESKFKKDFEALIQKFLLQNDKQDYTIQDFENEFEPIKAGILNNIADNSKKIDAENKLNTLRDERFKLMETEINKLSSKEARNDVLKKMSFSVNLRFARARLTSETPEQQNLTIRLENALLNSNVISRIPFLKRNWVQAGLFLAVNIPAYSLRQSARLLSFIPTPAISGLTSGVVEYFRKKQEMDITRSRVTSMLARGSETAFLPSQLNVHGNNEILELTKSKLVDVVSLENDYRASNDGKVKYEILAKFYAALQVSKKNKTDLFYGVNATHSEIQASRTYLLQQYELNKNEVSQFHKTDDLEAENQRKIEENEKLFNALRRSTSLRSAAAVGATAAALSFTFGVGSPYVTKFLQDFSSDASQNLSQLFESSRESFDRFIKTIASQFSSETKVNISVENGALEGARFNALGARPGFGEGALVAAQESDINTRLHADGEGAMVGARESDIAPKISSISEEISVSDVSSSELPPKTDEMDLLELQRESFLSGPEATESYLKDSDYANAMPERIVGTAEAQVAQFGGLTRSNWENNELLSIVGRVPGTNQLKDLYGFYDEPNQLKVWVNFTDTNGITHSVDATKLMSASENARGSLSGYTVDFSKDDGILGAMWRNGGNTHEGFLRQIDYIGYGFAESSDGDFLSGDQDFSDLTNSNSNLVRVARIDGGGNFEDIDKTVPITEPTNPPKPPKPTDPTIPEPKIEPETPDPGYKEVPDDSPAPPETPYYPSIPRYKEVPENFPAAPGYTGYPYEVPTPTERTIPSLEIVPENNGEYKLSPDGFPVFVPIVQGPPYAARNREVGLKDAENEKIKPLTELKNSISKILFESYLHVDGVEQLECYGLLKNLEDFITSIINKGSIDSAKFNTFKTQLQNLGITINDKMNISDVKILIEALRTELISSIIKPDTNFRDDILDPSTVTTYIQLPESDVSSLSHSEKSDFANANFIGLFRFFKESKNFSDFGEGGLSVRENLIKRINLVLSQNNQIPTSARFTASTMKDIYNRI
ncbi:hypothetical protein EBU91_01250, partial [bacterium]|nr:hypothetical protein [bacterium]